LDGTESIEIVQSSLSYKTTLADVLGIPSIIANAALADMAEDTIKGRQNGAGTGAPQDLTAANVKTILGYPTSTTDNRLLKTDSTSGNLQQTGITVDDSDNISGIGTITSGDVDVQDANPNVQLTETDASNRFGRLTRENDALLVQNEGSASNNGTIRFTGKFSGDNVGSLTVRRGGTNHELVDIGTDQEFTGNITFSNAIELASGGPTINFGSGTPEGAVTADVGSTFHRTDGGASTSFYVKESGTGNTGWVAK
jgi:hypothetical protein